MNDSMTTTRGGKRRRLVIAGIAVVVALLSVKVWTAKAQDRAPELPWQVRRAVATVTTNGETVLSFAYPTVKFRAVASCIWWKTDDGGYLVGCPFNYIDDGAPSHRFLKFYLNGGGVFTAVADGDGPGSWPPFLTVNLARDILAQMAKDELAKNRASTDEDSKRLLRLLAQKPSPERVLLFLLNVDALVR